MKLTNKSLGLGRVANVLSGAIADESAKLAPFGEVWALRDGALVRRVGHAEGDPEMQAETFKMFLLAEDPFLRPHNVR